MNTRFPKNPRFAALDYEQALAELAEGKTAWARLGVEKRIELLERVKAAALEVADDWVALADAAKGIGRDARFAGEEWFTGPYALQSACSELIATLSHIEGRAYLDPLKKRQRANGQLAVQVMPSNIWDHIIFSGIRAEIWMQDGVDASNLKSKTAGRYDTPPEARNGAVSLVLGAGNVAAIALLDVLHKLFNELEVCLLKLNPVNEYLLEPLQAAFQPLIEANALRIVKGDGAVGAWLIEHGLVENIHITGSVATYDAIVWGKGAEAKANRRKNSPKLTKPITSELGAVTPVIVVPGPWSARDLRHHAQNLAAQKLVNSGFNCVAGQVYVLPQNWSGTEALLKHTKAQLGRTDRPIYYPGADARMQAFREKSKKLEEVSRGQAPPVLINQLNDDPIFARQEYFAPVMSLHMMDAPSPETFLENAIAFANNRLYGTLSAHIMIHPKTLARIGRARFDEILGDLRYGSICINGYAGLNFLMTRSSWGAFPGHDSQDIQSGTGTVHNTLMFDHPERTVVEAPFYPFPRSLLHGHPSILPKPPWFLNNKAQRSIARAMTYFYHRPSITGLIKVIGNALRG